MTVEKQIQDKIYELINNVNKTIPVDWDELYINSEMSETGGNVYFFFKLPDNDKLFYSLLIPDDFKVDEKTFEKMDYQNYVLARELWNIFENNHIEVWKNASFIYKNNKLIICYSINVDFIFRKVNSIHSLISKSIPITYF